MLFFRQQLAYWRERHGAEHIGPLQRSSAFRALIHSMRDAAAAYLDALGAAEAHRLAHDAPLFCWASVHLGSSTHPPHVHSDACVTGTYYARRPVDASPILFEDPRGRSPFDLVAGLEHRLRYGEQQGGGGGGALPPFDHTVAIRPEEGECVLFPPWLVHSVPPASLAHDEPQHSEQDVEAALGAAARDEPLLRVSFSFNLLGRWEHTARIM